MILIIIFMIIMSIYITLLFISVHKKMDNIIAKCELLQGIASNNFCWTDSKINEIKSDLRKLLKE